MTDSEILQVLRESKAVVLRLAKCVTNEMHEKGRRGQVWQSDMCAAWPAYLAAIDKSNALIDKYLT